MEDLDKYYFSKEEAVYSFMKKRPTYRFQTQKLPKKRELPYSLEDEMWNLPEEWCHIVLFSPVEEDVYNIVLHYQQHAETAPTYADRMLRFLRYNPNLPKFTKTLNYLESVISKDSMRYWVERDDAPELSEDFLKAVAKRTNYQISAFAMRLIKDMDFLKSLVPGFIAIPEYKAVVDSRYVTDDMLRYVFDEVVRKRPSWLLNIFGVVTFAMKAVERIPERYAFTHHHQLVTMAFRTGKLTVEDFALAIENYKLKDTYEDEKESVLKAMELGAGELAPEVYEMVLFNNDYMPAELVGMLDMWTLRTYTLKYMAS